MGVEGRELLRGRLVLPDEVLPDGVVELSDGLISGVRAARTGDPAPCGTVLPGLVDVHCHGGGGHSFATTAADEVAAAAGFHHARGTTTVVASLVTDGLEQMVRQTGTLAAATRAGVVAGVHLEGPFLSPVRRGAHPGHHLLAPDASAMHRLLEAGDGQVRQVTLAPELPGTEVLADLVRGAGAVVAVGHSDSDAATAGSAFDRGAQAVTHLFNAMRPWHHRGSSVVTAALTAAAQGRTTVELVADGTHLDAGTVAAVTALLPGRFCLVSDAVPAAGLPDGTHRRGGATLRVDGGVARTGDGTIAGGTGSLVEVLAFSVAVAGVPLVAAVAAATRVPAALLGLDRRLGVGSLVRGARADVLVVDDRMVPLQVWRDGARVG